MNETLSIPIVLHGRKCRINVVREMFSNTDDVITVVWYGDDNEEIEHCYEQDLPASDRLEVLRAIEEFDKNEIKKTLY